MRRKKKMGRCRAGPFSFEVRPVETTSTLESLLVRGAKRLTGHQRRLFIAEVTLEVCDSSPRKAERRFGWGRETVAKGLHELKHGMRCLENLAARARPRF